MGMLAAECDYVIGVDTHRDTHTLVICDHLGAPVCERRLEANAIGYRRALALVRRHAPGTRAWAIEGVGAYGAGLARSLEQAGERVLEGPCPTEWCDFSE